MISRSRALASLLLLAAPAGCTGNFDPRLYQAAEMDTSVMVDVGTDAFVAPDAGMDGGTDGGMDAGFDAGNDAGNDAAFDAARDAGLDSSIPTLTLADFCSPSGSVPMIPRPALATDAVNTAYLVDTTGLLDDVSDVAACTGASEPGRDGFASVMMMANERWHFHLRRPTVGTNAALYILDSACDERTCSGGAGQDLCGPSSDEHFSFVAPSTGLYFLGVDSEAAGGFTAELDVIRPVCGNRMREHSEGCDDGNTMGGDLCDALCRAELASGANEAEANDDTFSANHLILATTGPTTINGRVASACESDVFAFDIPPAEVGEVTVSLGLQAGGCPANDVVPVSLAVLAPNGTNVLASTTLGAAGGCPMVGGAASTLAALPPGTYYARVRSIGTATPTTALDYRLTLTATLTP